MKTITRFFAFILAFLFILTLPVSLMSFNAGRVFFNQTFLQATLTDAVTESELIPRALVWFSEELAPGLSLAEAVQEDLAAVLISLTQEDWQAIRGEVLSDEILTGWVSSGLNGFYAWLDSEIPVLTLTLDMEPFKTRLDSDYGLRAMDIAYNALPTCNETEIEEFKVSLANAAPNTNVYYPPCQLPEPYRENQLTDYLNSLDEMVEAIPDSYDVPGENSSQDAEAWQSLKSVLQIFLIIYWLGLVVSIFLFGMVIFLMVRTPRSLARWGGLPLALTGIGSILLSWTLATFVNGFLVRGPLQDVSPLVQDEILAVVSRVLGEAMIPMMVQGLVVLVTGGLIIVIVGGMMSKQPAKKTREGTKP